MLKLLCGSLFNLEISTGFSALVFQDSCLHKKSTVKKFADNAITCTQRGNFPGMQKASLNVALQLLLCILAYLSVTTSKSKNSANVLITSLK